MWASKVVGIVVEASMAALIGRHHKDCCSQTDCRHRVVEETFQEILGMKAEDSLKEVQEQKVKDIVSRQVSKIFRDKMSI